MFLFFTFLLSIVRINYPTEEINYIPKLEPKQIQKFISQNSVAILFFTNNPKECSFANFAISHFSKKIQFAIAPESEGNIYQCKSYPCITSFINGTRNQIIRQAPHQETLFGHWCKENLGKNVIKLKNVEHLRLLLNSNDGHFVIGVSIMKRPTSLPSNIPYYYCRQDQINLLSNHQVPKGIYVFRGADHLLSLVENDNYLDLFKSTITPYKDIDPKNKKFTAGFYFGTNDQTYSESKMNLLLNLSNILNEDFYFTRYEKEIIYNSKLQFTKSPLFVVFNNSEPQMINNWYASGNDTLNLKYLIDFLTKIKENKLDYMHRSQSNKYSIDVDHFDDYLYNSNENDSILIITDNFTQYADVKSTTDAVLLHLNSATIDLFTLNATINDMPNMINPKTLPALYFFQGGKNKKENPPILYHGDFVFHEIMDFIIQTATSNLQVMPYDSVEKSDFINKIKDMLINK